MKLHKPSFKNILLIVSLFLLPYLAKADAQEQIGSVLIPLFVVLVNIPAVIAFLFLRYNLMKPGKALVINFFIWILYMLPFGSAFMLWVENDFTTENFFIDTTHGLLIWIPMTIIFTLTAIVYLNSRNKKEPI